MMLMTVFQLPVAAGAEVRSCEMPGRNITRAVDGAPVLSHVIPGSIQVDSVLWCIRNAYVENSCFFFDQWYGCNQQGSLSSVNIRLKQLLYYEVRHHRSFLPFPESERITDSFCQAVLVLQ